MLVGDNADPRPPMRDDLYSAASNLKSEIHHLDEVNDCMPELQESYRKTTTRRFYDVTALLSTHQNVSLTLMSEALSYRNEYGTTVWRCSPNPSTPSRITLPARR